MPDCGNCALTVVLVKKFAETSANLIPLEIFDYAHDTESMRRTPRFVNSRTAYQRYVILNPQSRYSAPAVGSDSEDRDGFAPF